MKICFLHMTMGVVNRGSEISTDLIASGLASKHEVVVVGAGNHHNNTYKYIQTSSMGRGIKSAPTNILESILFRLYLDKQSQQIKRFTTDSIGEISKFDPDIIIPTNGKVQLQIVRANFPNSKIVVFGRAGIGWNDRDNLSTKPDLFIALSKKASVWACDIADKDTGVSYIPNPVDIDHFKKTAANRIDLKHPIVLVVGALTKYKNIDLVIKAVAKTSASLLVLGRGEKEESLKELAEKLLPQRHLFTHITYEELPHYFRASDTFCFMPDTQEAFGRVYIEAMASGLPIVAPGDPIRKDIIGNKGFYSGYDPVEIAEKIKEALKVDKVDYSEELERFSAETVVGKIEKELSILNTKSIDSGSSPE